MALSSQVKQILNKFALSQPALQTPGLPYPSSSMALGDVLENLSSACVVKAQYAVTTASGTVGTHGLGVVLPKNCIVTRLWTDAVTAFDSGGSATVAIEAGSAVLKSATAFDNAAYVGVDAQSLTPVKLAAESELEIVVADAALTDGLVNVYVEYLK